MAYRLLNSFRGTKKKSKKPTEEVPLLDHQQKEESLHGKNSLRQLVRAAEDWNNIMQASTTLRQILAMGVIEIMDNRLQDLEYQKVLSWDPLVVEITEQGMIRMILQQILQGTVDTTQVAFHMISTGELSAQELMNLRNAVPKVEAMLNLLHQYMNTRL
ncbi:C protein [Parajeilongvirus brazilense]|nr:C protein [Diaemus bat paramyxovirus]